MSLTDLKVKNAKSLGKRFKLADGDGLYLLVMPTGSKLWRYDFRHAGSRKTLALGIYPEVGIAKARERLREAREQLSDGLDPSLSRKAAKAYASLPTPRASKRLPGSG